MILIVTYDLRSPKDYHDLYEVVKQQGTWWHYMASTWLLSTTKEPQQVVDAMLPHMEMQDLLFVGEITPKYQGRLPKAAWEWIALETKNAAFPSYANALLSGLAGIPPIDPYAPPTMPDTKGNLNPWVAPRTVPGIKPDTVPTFPPGWRPPPVEKK
jgi:hypothetical protein